MYNMCVCVCIMHMLHTQASVMCVCTMHMLHTQACVLCERM